MLTHLAAGESFCRTTRQALSGRKLQSLRDKIFVRPVGRTKCLRMLARAKLYAKTGRRQSAVNLHLKILDVIWYLNEIVFFGVKVFGVPRRQFNFILYTHCRLKCVWQFPTIPSSKFCGIIRYMPIND